MVRVQLKKVLDDYGKTLYWLGHQPGLKYSTVYKIYHGQTKGIEYNTLDLICRHVGCKLGELIIREEEQTSGKKGAKGKT